MSVCLSPLELTAEMPSLALLMRRRSRCGDVRDERADFLLITRRNLEWTSKLQFEAINRRNQNTHGNKRQVEQTLEHKYQGALQAVENCEYIE